MEITLSNSALDNFNKFDEHISKFTIFPEIFYASGLEHYRLLAYLSTFFNNELLLDVGTRTGYSAIALAFNPLNNVISYDIQNYLQLENLHEALNLTFAYDSDITILNNTLQSKLIMLDVDPHDGIYETKIIKYLKDNKWNGILILDDTRQDLWPAIYDVVNNEIDVKKIDVTKYGHFSGTHILNFDENIQFKLQ